MAARSTPPTSVGKPHSGSPGRTFGRCVHMPGSEIALAQCTSGAAAGHGILASPRHSELPRFWQFWHVRVCLGFPRGFPDKTYTQTLYPEDPGSKKPLPVTLREAVSCADRAPRAPGGEGITRRRWGRSEEHTSE